MPLKAESVYLMVYTHMPLKAESVYLMVYTHMPLKAESAFIRKDASILIRKRSTCLPEHTVHTFEAWYV
uniref:Uncharacterized protein n=1 Tax=Anguilla anguilla TaxID=7936 RepID=A0A0E9RIG1_ANGAN